MLATARSTVTGRDEPMAFVYSYGQGRIFQTVLGPCGRIDPHAGHRRADCAAARLGPPAKPQRHDRREPIAAPAPAAPQLAPEGKFGAALDPRPARALAERKPSYERRPLTVECWAKLDGKAGFNILVASNPKESAEHWELYTYAGTGELSLYLPGFAPAEIRSGVDVVDGSLALPGRDFRRIAGQAVCRRQAGQADDDCPTRIRRSHRPAVLRRLSAPRHRLRRPGRRSPRFKWDCA